MTRILDWHDSLAERTVSLARTTQAYAIEIVDRVSGAADGRPESNPCLYPVAVLLGLSRRWAGEPREIIDRTYAIVAQLVELHREFAHRLLDTVDLQDADCRSILTDGGRIPAAPDEAGRVLRFPPGGLASSR